MKKILSLILALVMVLGLVPMTPMAHAEEAVHVQNELEGKTLSILGASISTYAGTSNGSAADTTNSTIRDNVKYYPNTTIPEIVLNDTWWMQVCADMGLRLLVNNSWSGSSLLHTRNGTVGAYVDRCVQLHDDTGDNAGEVPDIIGIQMGTNDFQYYKDTLGTADIDYDTLITQNGDGPYSYAEPTTSLEAAAIVLHKISVRYPDAEVYYLNISQRIDGTDELIRSFNAELKQVVEHFDAHIVDIYGSAITMAEFDTYVGDGKVHPNCLGMDAYAEAFKRALIEHTAYTVDTHTVSMELDGVTADYGDDKIVVSGDSFSVHLTAVDELKVTVIMGGKDITDQAYSSGTVTIDAVTDDVTITAESVHSPKNYRWEFNGTDLVCVSGDNPLTKKSGTTTDGVFSKTSYALAGEVVLLHNLPWTVEWKCEGTFLNTGGSSGARIFTSDAVNANYNARYIFKSNTNGLIAMGEKDTKGSHNYGIALGDHGIDWTELHTYRLENRIAENGSNMIYLFVDGVEVGPMNNYYVGTADKGTASDWLSGKDFVFPYMGTDTHGFTNCSVEYIAVWEGGHTHEYTAAVTAPTCTEQGYTTYTCECGDSYVADYVDAVGHSYANGICTVCGSNDPNPYAGKTIACIGNSITASVGVTKDQTDYVTLLAKSLEMDYIRLGASGTTLCAGGHATCNVNKLTEANLAGADVVTILMGINDFVQARNNYYRLGTVDSTDTSTVYGAAHMWCQEIEKLRQKDSLKDTEFYFMTPVITSWNNSVSSTRNWDQSKTNVHGYTLRDLCNAIIEVCALYDIPVIDLNLISGLYYNSGEDNTVTEFGGDGAHPGTVGHQMMADAIEHALLKDHLRDDHDHSYGSWITTTYPDCEAGEQQRVCSICTATEKRSLAGSGHDYKNGICTVCGAEHPNLANFEGKVISILGDSISTFAGYIPVADGFNLEHLARYPQDNLLTDVNETWWMQVITALGGKLGINDSWRGATVSGAVPVTTGTTGENAAMSNLTRIQNLGANGTPDVILFYGGTNDLAHVSKVGSFDPNTAPTTVDLTTKKWDNLAEAYVHTLLRLRHFYPDAQIVCLLPTYTTSYYSNTKLAQANEVLAQICEHYGVAYTDLRECGITTADLPDGIHPNAAGMDFITEATMETALDECEMEAGENVVHSVTHTLTGAKSSLSYYKGVTHGKAFVTAITGEEVTVSVTMGGVDITDAVYADGVVTIAAVTGDVVITAQGRVKTIYEDYLQQLPDEVCAGLNLWNVLEHDAEYYTASGWGVHTSGKVYSVTFPVSEGDRIYATSFGAAGSNGQSSVNGIRTTFFDADGLLITMGADKVYAEFAANGFVTVPEGAVAVNIPMWSVSDDNAIYLLDRDHVYANGVCTVCGEEDPNCWIVDLTAMEVSFDAEILMWTYFIIPDELLNDDGAKVLVTKNGAWGKTTTEITMAELRAAGPTAYGDYRIEQGIASGEMTREVTVQIVDGNGNYVSIRDYVSGNVDTKVVRTAADYAARVFEVGSAKQKELVKAMLTYGGYSQKHFNVDAGNPVYNLLTEYGYEIPALGDITAADIAQELSKSAVSNGVTYSAQEAYLDSAIYHRVYFKLAAGEEISNFRFEIELIDVYGKLYTETVTAMYDRVYDEYYVDIEDIAAAHLDHLYTVTVTNLTTGDTYEVTTSVLVWAKTVIARSYNVNQVNLAKAVYYYNQAANVFFGK